MSKQIQKSFRHGLSKIKISNKQIQHSLRSCKHIKTPSFSLNRNHNATENNDDSVTLSDIDQFLYENFRSLYRNEYEQELSKKTEPFNTSSYPIESPRLFDDPPPLENLCGSARFFVPTRSSSSMIIDEISSNDSSTTNETAADDSTDGSLSGPDNFITLLTYSPSPYNDFRQSLEEMVNARLEHNGKVDWEFMEELLFCYLDLNNEKSHRAIMRAFVDVIVALRDNSGRVPMSRRQVKRGTFV